MSEAPHGTVAPDEETPDEEKGGLLEGVVIEVDPEQQACLVRDDLIGPVVCRCEGKLTEKALCAVGRRVVLSGEMIQENGRVVGFHADAVLVDPKPEE